MTASRLYALRTGNFRLGNNDLEILFVAYRELQTREYFRLEILFVAYRKLQTRASKSYSLRTGNFRLGNDGYGTKIKL